MARVPSALVHQGRIDKAVRQAEAQLTPDVARIRHSIEDDWSGEPAIYFRVLLADAASREDRLRAITERVREVVMGRVDPYEYGLTPYFRFRSVSEQAELRDRAWE